MLPRIRLSVCHLMSSVSALRVSWIRSIGLLIGATCPCNNSNSRGLIIGYSVSRKTAVKLIVLPKTGDSYFAADAEKVRLFSYHKLALSEHFCRFRDLLHWGCIYANNDVMFTPSHEKQCLKKTGKIQLEYKYVHSYPACLPLQSSDCSQSYACACALNTIGLLTCRQGARFMCRRFNCKSRKHWVWVSRILRRHVG